MKSLKQKQTNKQTNKRKNTNRNKNKQTNKQKKEHKQKQKQNENKNTNRASKHPLLKQETTTTTTTKMDGTVYFDTLCIYVLCIEKHVLVTTFIEDFPLKIHLLMFSSWLFIVKK